MIMVVSLRSFQSSKAVVCIYDCHNGFVLQYLEVVLLQPRFLADCFNTGLGRNVRLGKAFNHLGVKSGKNSGLCANLNI